MSTLFSSITILNVDFPISIIWWFIFVAVDALFRNNTQLGNWIFATGASKKVRFLWEFLFQKKNFLIYDYFFCAWFIAIIQVTTFGGADVLRGEQKEFIAIMLQ